jgi:hypothetical protein
MMRLGLIMSMVKNKLKIEYYEKAVMASCCGRLSVF